ncbi:MAG: pyruvate carboxyltransferase [Solirubrobacterales bacterium]|jgi:isopropylmalate/homocitrate/citramalate synthase|nr:pyruvate carboxyltransferase [Solirubrobacterales bacterium]
MSVTICEVGPRDGLQNHPLVVAVADRIELIEQLSASGLPCIEAVSFVHPARVPAMSGAEAVLAGARPHPLTRLTGLVLNAHGLTRAFAAGLAELRYAFAVSDAFNRRNANRSAAEGRAGAVAAVRMAQARGVRIGVVLATAFGCPFEGEVDPGAVIDAAAELAAAGADELILADTIGVAVPRDVRRLVPRALPLGPTIGVHMHNTRNTGYLTTFAAIEAGATIVDAAVGGLGGCPFAPGATGNIATEDLVYALEREGITTGVDLDRLLKTAAWLERRLAVPLSGQLLRAGRFPAASAGRRSAKP